MKKERLFLLGLIFVLVLVGLATLESRVLLLALPLLAYLFAGAARRPAGLQIDVERSLSTRRTTQGVPLAVRLAITNRGPALDELLIEDRLPVGSSLSTGFSVRVNSLPALGEMNLDYTFTAGRGQYRTCELFARGCDFTGLFESQQVYRNDVQLIVQPRYAKIDRILIRPPQTRGFAGPIAARQGGSGVDFYGVREYQSGDPLRQINWKIASRHERELFTNVYEQERVADVGLILDARQRLYASGASGSLFEHALQAAAALAENFLDDGNRVSLLIYGGSIRRVFPGYGRIQRDRILRVLAAATLEKNYALDNLSYLPTRFFPARSQVVLISPLFPEDIPVLMQMRAHGYALMVISPDGIAFESGRVGDRASQGYRLAHAERELMLQQARRGGIQMVDWQVDLPLAAVLRANLARPGQAFQTRLGL